MYSLFLNCANRENSQVILFQDQKEFDRIEHVKDEVSAIIDLAKKHKLVPTDIEKVEINKGPGSFTGLKKAAAIANAFNFAKGAIKNWGDLILPEYGKEPNISKPKTI